jgi:hypothetical protein
VTTDKTPLFINIRIGGRNEGPYFCHELVLSCDY